MASSMDPSAILAQITGGYMKLPLVQKILFPVLVAASVSGIIFVSKWANRPDYVVLFSDLEAPDSAAVVERLRAQKIDYELRGDGRTVAVSPPEMVHELRISLAGEGVPKGGKVGFEIFDGTSLGTTGFVERLKYVRALQGELERTISSVDAVSSVRVHITQPEKTVFAKQGARPTASVMVKLRAGGELDKKQVKGIANLVAGSVEGLRADDVSVVDTFGNLLSTKEDDPKEAFGAEATRMQYQSETERGYAQRIEQMLQKVLGPGKVVARVTAEMDFSSNEREEESFDPGGQVIRSEKTTSEGSGANVRGGVPGVVSNLTAEPNLLSPPEQSKETSSRNESVKNYEVSRAVTRVSSPRGRLVRLSAAVLVDGTYEDQPAAAPAAGSSASGAAAPAPKRVFKPLGAEMLAQIETLVKGSIGYDSSRGDIVKVENIQFYDQDGAVIDALDEKATQDMVFGVLSKVGPVVFLLLFFMVMVRPMVKFLTTPTEAETDLERLLPTGLSELEKELEAERSKASSVPVFEPSVDLEQLEELMAENSRIVKENPQQAALLIRYWLNDGRL